MYNLQVVAFCPEKDKLQFLSATTGRLPCDNDEVIEIMKAEMK